ncbi:DUF6308 family protein [Dactylosporangium sp. CS-047395]|uniref:DUF6308 family protein n=1 Tax=Dactylosporangium sp. CS-047395 TaxID=3239936 RepID=UPI003D917E49
MRLSLVDIVFFEGVNHLRPSPLQTFRGGGDRPETRDRIAVDDLYGIEAIGPPVPFRVGLSLLEGDLREDFDACLRDIPADAELGTPGAEALIAPGGRLEEAHRLVREACARDYQADTIAANLLARKRPRLVFLAGRGVACQFGQPGPFMQKVHRRLAANDGELRAALARARAAANLDEDTVSLVQALGTILGSRHGDHWDSDRAGSKCPYDATVVLE